MDSEQTSGRPAYILWLLPVLVLVSGLALTAMMAPRSVLTVDQLVDDLSRAHHEQLSRALSRRISDTLGAAAQLARDREPGFNSQASEFLDHFPAIAGLELLSRVNHSQRPMIERSLSEQSGQFIRFATWTGRFSSGVADESDQYLIIRRAHFQPETIASDSSLGLVATSVPHWRGALNRALEEGHATATTLTELHRNGTSQSALRVFVPSSLQQAEEARLVSLVLRPDVWLSQNLADLHDPRWQVELHDISQYARHPMASMPADGTPASDIAATRSTLSVADREWMLSTTPAAGWLDDMRQQVLWPAWLTGLTITLLASALTLWAIWLTLRTERLLERRTRRARHLGQQLDNTRVEKNILHHSLQESDRRTRDLIDLGAGIFAELDEGRHIGYISPQVATLLNIPSTDLLGSPLDAMFDESDHKDLSMAFDAARRDHSIQRLDTEVMTRNSVPLPVALRIKALKDPLSGCSGFRVSLTPRQ
ncbi:CHASE domain-containing protein [Marinobacter lacisalsi]|uniref:CHASE domain-containing protein n=1 Tax=Marinobacter lacisalsi TaxID=475979 RepID=A0ABV8QF33_9GAMM